MRFLPKQGALVEITQRTFQGRLLLRPSERFNALAVGCFAHAQKNTSAKVHAVACLSNHFHLLASFDSVQQMASFMCQLKTSLSLEIGYFHDWQGSSWDHRYHSIPVSDEDTAQQERLRYLLSQGCKENLVMSPRDWPGVHSASALITGESLQGVWIDRTAFHKSLKRGERVRLNDFEQKIELQLSPLPSWTHLPAAERCKRTEDLVDGIEVETRLRHSAQRTAPAGAAAICRRHPWQKAEPLVRRPKPRFHAFARSIRASLHEAFQQFLCAYRAAADKLKGGDLQARFPPNCFPPRLPFIVPPAPPEPG